MEISKRIGAFKQDLIEESLNAEGIVYKHIIDTPTYFFQDILRDSQAEYFVRSTVAQFFSVHTREVVFVGSGKIGFSLSPLKLFNEFDNAFSKSRLNKDRSDIDIAIISDTLYKGIGEKMYNFTAAYESKWQKNEYYSLKRAGQFQVPICYKYFEYYTKGWFRPDFKPYGFEFCTQGSYEDLKGKLYKKTGRKVSIAIYQSWFYFINYHIVNINNLSLKIKTEKI